MKFFAQVESPIGRHEQARRHRRRNGSGQERRRKADVPDRALWRAIEYNSKGCGDNNSNRKEPKKIGLRIGYSA